MNNNKNRGRAPGIAVGLLATAGGALLLASATASAQWDLGVTADLGVTHTDNLFLAPEDQEESDTVYTVSPTFTLESDGERTQADIRYRPEAYFYSDFSDADEVYHVVDAAVTTELLRERLFLYVSGIHFQSITDPDLAFPTTNLPVTGNRVDSTVLEARPSWQQKLGSAELRIEAGYRDLEYDGDQFQSSVEKDALFGINNFAQQQGLAWGLDYSYRRLEYDVSQPFEFQRASANLGFWVSSALRLFGVGGAETSVEDILESNLDDNFWEAGFQYAPNQRLNLELAAGERSYGTSFRGDFSYTLRRGSLSISYDESPSSRSEGLFDTRPLVDGDNLDNILDRPGNADRFVRKRGEAKLSVELNKSEIGVRVFTEERENRTTETGTALDDESLSGMAADFRWRFGTKTSLELGADIARRDDGANDDDLSRFSVGIAYDFSPKTSIRVEGLRSEQDGGQASDYTENQGRLTFRIELL